MSKKVLVVGGSGFIGSRLLAKHPRWDNCDLKNGKDFFDALNIFEYPEYDTIVLLAARHLTSTPEDYIYNLDLYMELLKQSDNLDKQPHIVFASSAAIYGPTMWAAKEQFTPDPRTLYGKSKVVGEQIIRDFCETYTILRFSNVYGNGDGHGAIDKFIRGEKTIYGDGNNIRDYVPVETVVKAISRVVADPKTYSGETFNISTGEGMTTNEVFEKFGSGKPKHVAEREGDILASVLDNTKAYNWGLLQP